MPGYEREGMSIYAVYTRMRRRALYKLAACTLVYMKDEGNGARSTRVLLYYRHVYICSVRLVGTSVCVCVHLINAD